jgi:3-oxoacyl-[acyl-carrier protein] reductase
MKLKGRVALVSGSSRGIGKAIANSFAKEGASVIVTYKKNEDLAKKVAEDFNDYLIIKLDVSKRESIKNTVKKIMKKYGRLDILVNNAGINKPEDFEDVTDRDWDLIMTTNLKGPFMLTQEIFSVMKKQRFGRIINISSVSGQYGGPRTVHYAVSKAGLIALGHCFARFGAPYNITSNNIAPGLIITEMGNKMIETKLGKKILSNTLLNRPGTTQEVARMAVFLASDDSSYITGQTFNVNGGLLFS